MAGITLKKLDSIEKTLEGVFEDDPEQLEALGKSMTGLRAAIKKGETVTMDDVSDILGEVVIDKAIDAGAASDAGDDVAPEDPIAPILKTLYDELFDKGKIRKGVTEESTQELFDKAYQAVLGELDGAISATAEATAIELGAGDKVNFGKVGKKPDPTDDADDDEDCDDMEKLLKGLNIPSPIINKIGSLQSEVAKLRTERDLETFGKAAVGIGEPEAFGADLLKLHRIDPKLAESVKKRLQAKNELLKKSGQWAAEIGENGDRVGTAYDQLVAHANDIVNKGGKDAKGAPLSFAKAFTQATEQHPELYSQYLEEQRRR